MSPKSSSPTGLGLYSMHVMMCFMINPSRTNAGLVSNLVVSTLITLYVKICKVDDKEKHIIMNYLFISL